ncbi:hypothetical protein B0H16DRAFT_1379540, partial [Mycena metata]
MTTMNTLPTQPLKPGLVYFPGSTPESTALVAKLLHKDYEAHHCFHNDQNFSNHLSHHILSLHDLGAPTEWIRAMYEKEAATQRPLHLNGVPDKASPIDETNWKSHLGKQNALRYPDYLSFFSGEIGKHGVGATLERYVFSPEANANGTFMLARFIGSLLHPIIETGLGLEFGQDFMVAQGLSQAALAAPVAAGVMHEESGLPEIQSGAESATLLSLLRELYDSPDLTPAPYETQQLTPERLSKWTASNPAGAAAIRAIYAKWTFNINLQDPTASDAHFAKKVEECMWQATLLLGATGKRDRAPRMDFYLMHFLTGSLFLGVVVDALKSPLHKAQLLHAYVRSAALFVILRGRPRIDPALAMSYPVVSPTSAKSKPSNSGSPWLALLNNATMHTEPHVVKSIRMLFYCAQKYGATPAGGVIGALASDGARKGEETHEGAAGLDGTLFVRVAGKMTDAVGWVMCGEGERFWDFGGIGWEEAWREED